MVARAAHYNIPAFRHPYIFDQRICTGPFYLYLILMKREKALETVIVLALASLIAMLWLDVSWLIFPAIGLLAISLISKRLTGIIGKGWLAFSFYLGIVMNYVSMFVIYYFFLTPISFFQRLAGSNQILKKRKTNSHFHQRNHLYTHKDIKNPW